VNHIIKSEPHNNEVWSTCHWGGVKMAQAVFSLLKHDDDALEEMLGLAIGWWG
jgi:hypothetical protein